MAIKIGTTDLIGVVLYNNNVPKITTFVEEGSVNVFDIPFVLKNEMGVDYNTYTQYGTYYSIYSTSYIQSFNVTERSIYARLTIELVFENYVTQRQQVPFWLTVGNRTKDIVAVNLSDSSQNPDGSWLLKYRFTYEAEYLDKITFTQSEWNQFYTPILMEKILFEPPPFEWKSSSQGSPYFTASSVANMNSTYPPSPKYAGYYCRIKSSFLVWEETSDPWTGGITVYVYGVDEYPTPDRLPTPTILGQMGRVISDVYGTFYYKVVSTYDWYRCMPL